MYQYPYGNAQQLNLDWILSKIQELETSASVVNIEDVANVLVSASFDTGVSYRRYDYCFYNGKLYRALNDTTGAFNPADWLEVVIGDDIPVLTRLLNAVDASLTSLQNIVNELDSDDIDNASSVTGTTVSDALETLNTALGDLDSDDIDNASTVSGSSVSDALETLDTDITNLQNDVSDLDSDDIDNASLVVSGATVTAALDALQTAINGKENTITNINSSCTLTIQSSNYTLSCYRYGKVVWLNIFDGPKTLSTQSGWVTVGTLPENYRPPVTLLLNTRFNDTNVQIRIQTNGEISFAGIPAITDAYIIINTMYIAN